MSCTGYKQAFWDKQPIITCPKCSKKYKHWLSFCNHLEYFHNLGYEGTLSYLKCLSQEETEKVKK